MEFNFRKLKTTDLTPMISIVSKIGLDEIVSAIDMKEVRGMVTDENKNDEQTMWNVGFFTALKLANKVLEGLPKCEKEIYELLASVSGMSVKDIKELDLDVFVEMVAEFVKKDEFKSFFKVASKLVR